MKKHSILFLSLLFLLTTAEQCFQFDALNLLSEVRINQKSAASVEAKSRLVDFEGAVSQHGHVWSSSPNPVLGFNSAATNMGAKTNRGEFMSLVANLNFESTYFIRAYMIVNDQVVYGKESTFTTRNISKPAEYLNLQGFSDLKNTSAIAGAKIEKLASGSQALKYGFCWASTKEPTIANNKIEFTNPLGTTTFTGNLTGLNPNTTYYIRAYMITNQSNGQAIYSSGTEDKITTTNN